MNIYSNFMLKFSAQDMAVVDRIAIITYLTRFVHNPLPGSGEKARDSALVQSFVDDPDAVGTWLALGAQKAIKDINEFGEIPMPEVVKADTKREIKKMDTIASFVESRVEIHEHVHSSGIATQRIFRDISKKVWTWEKEAMFTCFFGYLQSSGCSDRYDVSNFNNCIDRYFVNNRHAVRTLRQDGKYFWWGLRAIRSDLDAGEATGAQTINSMIAAAPPRPLPPPTEEKDDEKDEDQLCPSEDDTMEYQASREPSPQLEEYVCPTAPVQEDEYLTQLLGQSEEERKEAAAAKARYEQEEWSVESEQRMLAEEAAFDVREAARVERLYGLSWPLDFGPKANRE